MARILGINIPDNKRVVISLTYIYGIGDSLSQLILENLKISPDTRVKDLSSDEIESIRQYIEKNYRVEGDLRILINQNISRMKDIGSYRGLRHLKKLPVHGQRTKTNARTKRGRKITVGSGRKASAQKT